MQATSKIQLQFTIIEQEEKVRTIEARIAEIRSIADRAVANYNAFYAKKMIVGSPGDQQRYDLLKQKGPAGRDSREEANFQSYRRLETKVTDKWFAEGEKFGIAVTEAKGLIDRELPLAESALRIEKAKLDVLKAAARS